MSDNSDYAKRVLGDYFSLLFKKSGLEWNMDNQIEIDSVIDDILNSLSQEKKSVVITKELVVQMPKLQFNIYHAQEQISGTKILGFVHGAGIGKYDSHCYLITEKSGVYTAYSYMQYQQPIVDKLFPRIEQIFV